MVPSAPDFNWHSVNGIILGVRLLPCICSFFALGFVCGFVISITLYLRQVYLDNKANTGACDVKGCRRKVGFFLSQSV